MPTPASKLIPPSIGTGQGGKGATPQGGPGGPPPMPVCANSSLPQIETIVNTKMNAIIFFIATNLIIIN